MRIEIAKRARRQVERISRWWDTNRPAGPDLHEREFEEALDLLIAAPKAGVANPTVRRPGLRRLILPKTQYHLHFCLEHDETVVVIHSVWGARRGSTPKLQLGVAVPLEASYCNPPNRTGVINFREPEIRPGQATQPSTTAGESALRAWKEDKDNEGGRAEEGGEGWVRLVLSCAHVYLPK